MHLWHEKHNAVFVDAGVWLRPRYYKNGDELYSRHLKEKRKMLDQTLEFDVTTLGKIDIKGPDAAEFLNRFILTLSWYSWQS